MRKEVRTILERDVVTVPEASRLSGKARTSLTRRVSRKTLESVRKGGVILLDRQDIEAMKADN